METDGVAGEVAAVPDPEPLPDVIIGAEPWHNALPPVSQFFHLFILYLFIF
jgi:hypothetical protein